MIYDLLEYNTRIVASGTTLLGFAAGVIGPFMLLRRRALIGDAISHSTLPGICAAFLILYALNLNPKNLPFLLLGGATSGIIGAATILAITRYSRIKEDTALGIVLSVFFGLGVALLGIIQKSSSAQAAGLEQFIYGKTASMIASDAMLIAIIAALVALSTLVLFKELTLLCFDDGFAHSQGWPTIGIDSILMLLVISVVVIGLQAVGLVLVIALLVIPAAAARFWTHRLLPTVVISALIGAASGLCGALISTSAPRLPAGAIIVLVCGSFFLFSLLFGSARGLVRTMIEQQSLQKKVSRQHLLRALYEFIEVGIDGGNIQHSQIEETSALKYPVTRKQLLMVRSWQPRQLQSTITECINDYLLKKVTDDSYALTLKGLKEAARLVENHRLWELYLIKFADIAPSHVDRDADRVEHILGAELVTALRKELSISMKEGDIPPTPHLLSVAAIQEESPV